MLFQELACSNVRLLLGSEFDISEWTTGWAIHGYSSFMLHSRAVHFC